MNPRLVTSLITIFIFCFVNAQTRGEEKKYKNTPQQSESSSNSQNESENKISEEPSTPTANNSDLKDKLFLGGGFGMSFGSVTNIAISPVVGYKVKPNLHMGISSSFQYFKYNDLPSSGWSYDNEFISYSAGLFARAIALDFILLHAEFSNYWFEGYDYNDPNFYLNPKKSRISIPTFLVGGGLAQNAGGAVITIEILYDLIQNQNLGYIYPTGFPTIIRMGATFSL